MANLRNQIERQQRTLDPELKSWIDNVLVPSRVGAYLAEHGESNGVAARSQAVRESEPNVTLSAEGIR